MNEPRIQVDGIDTPSPFEAASSALKQPMRISDLAPFFDPIGGFEEQRVLEVGTSENLLGYDFAPLIVRQGLSDSDKVYVQYGLVNGGVPTIGGSSLTTTAPYPEITISGNTTVWLKVVGTFGSPDTYVSTIETTNSGDAISATGFTGHFPLGDVEYSGGEVTSVDRIFSGGNLLVRSMGNSIFWGKL